jgi:hypothetical protein
MAQGSDPKGIIAAGGGPVYINQTAVFPHKRTGFAVAIRSFFF